MLAYTAVDGLRVISRDFDFDWQPEVGENLSADRHAIGAAPSGMPGALDSTPSPSSERCSRSELPGCASSLPAYPDPPPHPGGRGTAG